MCVSLCVKCVCVYTQGSSTAEWNKCMVSLRSTPITDSPGTSHYSTSDERKELFYLTSHSDIRLRIT